MQSTVLNAFPSQSDDQRLLLLREVSPQGDSQLVLQQESRSDHVGWFVQSRIVIEAGQVAALKMTLTSDLAKESHPVNESGARQVSAEILSFASAMAS